MLPLPSPLNSRSADRVSVTNAIPLILEPLLITPGPTSHGPSSFGPVLNERYSLLHLQLLNHFEHELIAFQESFPPGLDAMLPIFIR